MVLAAAVVGLQKRCFCAFSAHVWRLYGTRFANALVCEPLHFGQSGDKHACFRCSTHSASAKQIAGCLIFVRVRADFCPRQRREMGAMKGTVVALALGEYS